ncbi:MAG: TIGR02996 domain-containing protein [Planctomycetes bacterium]|nr:TIGR02996 domain-containing protein [Planctomycetota bacterium]
MSDGDALRQAVLADPDEDTPRLIYADWLDENGQGDLAAFIRLQIEAVRADPFSVQVRNATKRAGALLEKYGAVWHARIREVIQGQLEDFVGVQVSNSLVSPLRDVVKVKARFERGFVGHVTLQPPVFVRAANGIFGAEPIQSLELIRFATPDDVPLEPVFEVPQLRHLRRLEFARPQQITHSITEEEYAAMLSCSHLSGLRDLSLRENVVPPPWLVDLFNGDQFPELQGLDIAEIPNLGPALVNAFARANHREIRRLNVTGVVFTSDEMRQLLTSRCLRHAEELRLGGAWLSGRAGPLSHINPGWVLPLERLVILDLKGQRLGNEGVGDILKQSAASALRWLGLSFNGLDSGVLRFFTESKHLSLNHLDVRGNNFTPSGIKALKARFPDAVIEV